MKGDLKRAMENAYVAGMHGFRLDAGRSLIEEAARAVSRIYSAGIMIRDGEVSPGGNNVAASLAAAAFEDFHIAQLRNMTDNGMAEGLAEIIEARQAYTEIADASDDFNNPEMRALLQHIYDEVQILKAFGWSPDGEPTELDGQGRIVHRDRPGQDGPDFS